MSESEPEIKVHLFHPDTFNRADFEDYYAGILEGYVLDPRLHEENRLWVLKFGEDNYCHVAFMIKAEEEVLAKLRAETGEAREPERRDLLERGTDFVEITPPEKPGVIPEEFGEGWRFYKATKGSLQLVKVKEEEDA